MQEIIVKKSHTGQPVVFLADSYDTGRVKAFVDNEEKTLSIDYYNLAKPLAPEDAQKAIEAYRQHAKLPAEEIFVRHRLPKNYANLLPKATVQASAVDKAAELSGSLMAQQMAVAVQNRKNRRSEAAKKRYEAEMAATAAQAGNVAVSAAKTNGATALPQASQQERNNGKQLANVIAKAVASAVAEALKAIH